VAGGLHDIAAGMPHRLDHQLQRRIDDRAGVFRVEILHQATHRYSAKLVADGGTPLEARVGVNTGEVVVRTLTMANGHTEYTPIGHTANLASRMQAIAATGSIAITEHTRRLVEGYFQLKSRGPSR